MGTHDPSTTIVSSTTMTFTTDGGATTSTATTSTTMATTTIATMTTTSTSTLDKQIPMWQVTDGPCSIDAHHCLRSPNYPDNYDKKQSCTIEVDASLAAPIVATSFETEARYDKLVVNGASYSGSDGPVGVVPQGSISWSSDGSVQKSGFMLCPIGATSTTTTTTISSIPSMW